MTSIIAELSRWVVLNAEAIVSKGIQLTESYPEPSSPCPWKAGISFVHTGIIVSYTVWERTNFQTELIVMNSFTGNTIIMDENMWDDASLIHRDLDEVLKKIADGSYREMKPDPKLLIS